MKKTKTIHILGTGSGVGKSIINAGICRILRQDGYNVAPFKAQNMALNSFVTIDGFEIGRSQAVQAYSAGIKPLKEMNPLLLKPTHSKGSQVILNGKPFTYLDSTNYSKLRSKFRIEVIKAYKNLSKKYEYIVMEGAGSPVEVNIKKNDIVNMHMAKVANAPVILVADIDRGGVFAWIIGTLELLTKSERRRVKGIIINRFRGDKKLLESGLRYLEKKTGVPVLGVVPYYNDISIPEEDSVFLNKAIYKNNKNLKNKIKMSVIHLPHISNFTDFDPLRLDPLVELKFVKDNKDLKKSHVIIIPGSKNTIYDMEFLNKTGLSKKIIEAYKKYKTTIIGICGGFQMLGERIIDSKSVENKLKNIKGLGLLPTSTSFCNYKTLNQVKAKEIKSGFIVNGYEIHHGKTKCLEKLDRVFQIYNKNNKKTKIDDGFISSDELVRGTYIHGIFDNDDFRNNFLNNIRKRYGFKKEKTGSKFDLNYELDKLANHLRQNIDIEKLYKIFKVTRTQEKNRELIYL